MGLYSFLLSLRGWGREPPLPPTSPSPTQKIVNSRGYKIQFSAFLAWENSRHFVTLPLVNDVWETSAEIPYWWQATSKTSVVLLTGCSKFHSFHDQSEALPRSGQWYVISIESLRSFLRHHLAGKPVVGSQNVGCLFRLSIPSMKFNWVKY